MWITEGSMHGTYPAGLEFWKDWEHPEGSGPARFWQTKTSVEAFQSPFHLGEVSGGGKKVLEKTPENHPLEPELDSSPNGRLSLSLPPLVLYCISYS